MRYFLNFTLIIALFSISCVEEKPSENTKTTTYYFIRHAEKERSDASNENPDLTEIGKQRAEKWAEVFKNVPFDAIYSTDYNRTKQTAQPTATSNALDILSYNPRELFSQDFIKATKGKTVLIVGHSNTTPAFVNAVLKHEKYKDIDDSNNSNLYIVTLSRKTATDQLLLINLQ